MQRQQFAFKDDENKHEALSTMFNKHCVSSSAIMTSLMTPVGSGSINSFRIADDTSCSFISLIIQLLHLSMCIIYALEEYTHL